MPVIEGVYYAKDLEKIIQKIASDVENQLGSGYSQVRVRITERTRDARKGALRIAYVLETGKDALKGELE